MEQIISLGGAMHECKPLLVSNYQPQHPSFVHVLCAMGTAVNVLSATTGELIGSYNHHKSLITCIALANQPSSSAAPHIITSSVDGNVRVWNMETLEDVNQFQLPCPIYDILVPRAAREGKFLSGKSNHHTAGVDKELTVEDIQEQRSREELYLVCGNKPNEAGGLRVVAFDTDKLKIRRKVSNVSRARACAGMLSITMGDKMEEILVVADNRNLLIWSLATKTQIGTITYDADAAAITCLCVCQQRGMVITGHSHGMLCLWHNVDSIVKQMVSLHTTTQRAQCTTLHWHAHAVASIAVSADGINVFSGGEEGVLVLWQIDTGYKTFLPRLGASITHIFASDDDASVVVTTADNHIRIVNSASMHEQWAVRHVSIAKSQFKRQSGSSSEFDKLSKTSFTLESYHQADAHFRCSLAIEARTGFVACNGYPGELQMINMSPVVVTSHQIVPYTRISKKETSTRMYVPSISLFQFYSSSSGNAHYLATVDVARGQDTGAEHCLKLWTWSSARNKYRLTASVESPHGSSAVTALDFIPQSNPTSSVVVSCVTAAIDGSVKVWAARHPASQNILITSHDPSDAASIKGNLSWSCSYSFRYRESPCHAIRSSRDGSALAVAHGNLVTLWDTATLSLSTSFLSAASCNVSYVRFLEPCASPETGGGSGQCYLVVGASSELQVYDLLTLALVWAVRGDFTCFAVAERDEVALKRAGLPDGWIAAASRVYDVSVPIATEDLTDSEIALKKSPSSFKVEIFSPYRVDAVVCVQTPSSLTSMQFVPAAATADCNEGTLLMVTCNGQILIIPTSGEFESKISAKVSGPRVPALAVESVAPKQTSFSSGYDAGSHFTTTDFSLTEATSDYLPSVSELYDSFLGSLLKKPSKSLSQSDGLPQSTGKINGASVASSVHVPRDHFGNLLSAASTSSAVKTKHSKSSAPLELANSSVSAADRQQIFDANLLGFFGSSENVSSASFSETKVAGTKRRSNSSLSDESRTQEASTAAATPKRASRQSKR